MLRVGGQKQRLRDHHWIEIVSPETSRCECSCVDSFRQTAAPVRGVHIQSGNVGGHRAETARVTLILYKNRNAVSAPVHRFVMLRCWIRHWRQSNDL